jgi:hypothetical protein
LVNPFKPPETVSNEKINIPKRKPVEQSPIIVVAVTVTFVSFFVAFFLNGIISINGGGDNNFYAIFGLSSIVLSLASRTLGYK